MPVDALKAILACPSLPTFPAIAMRVIALMRKSDVRLDELASLIAVDQALTSKILRTVNSSFYGLTRPCTTVSRAVGYLGLSTVKSLVLGFSLVEIADNEAQDGFDFVGYWRRSVYSAAAARVISKNSGGDPEESFVAALLQDMGMLAARAALGAKYLEVLRANRGTHGDLPGIERGALSVDHAGIGAALAERWKLPAELAVPIRFHHGPDLAPEPYRRRARTVALARLASEALSAHRAQEGLRGYRARAAEWFGIDEARAGDMLKSIAELGGQLSQMLDLDTGASPDLRALLAEASDQMLAHQIELERQNITDALTSTFNRRHLDEVFAQAFRAATESNEPLALFILDADDFKRVNDTHGHRAGDAVLHELGRRFKETAGSRGLVFRYGGEEFAIVAAGMNSDEARRFGEQVRAAIAGSVFHLTDSFGQPLQLEITISVGASILAERTRSFLHTPEVMIKAADTAMYAAKRGGRNQVCVHGLAEDAQRLNEIDAARKAQPPLQPCAAKGSGRAAA